MSVTSRQAGFIHLGFHCDVECFEARSLTSPLQ